MSDLRWEVDLYSVDVLSKAVAYLRAIFRMDMTRDEAQANLDARVLILKLESQLLDEVEARYAAIQ